MLFLNKNYFVFLKNDFYKKNKRSNSCDLVKNQEEEEEKEEQEKIAKPIAYDKSELNNSIDEFKLRLLLLIMILMLLALKV